MTFGLSPILTYPVDAGLGVLLLVASGSLGWRIGVRFGLGREPAGLLIAAGWGIGLLCAALYLLGSAGRLQILPVAVLLAVMMSLSIPFVRALLERLSIRPFSTVLPRDLTGRIWLLTGLTLVLFHIVFGYAPPTDTDELSYQLSMAQFFASHGNLVTRLDNFCSFYPLAAQLIFAVLLMLRGALAVKAFMGITTLLCALTLWIFARSYLQFTTTRARIAVVLFLSMPCTTILTGVTTSDLLGVWLHLLALCLWWSCWDDPRHWKVAGITLLAGTALSMRPQSAVWIMVLAAVWALRGRRWKAPFLFLSCSGLFLVPWWIRNYLAVGNPFYPADAGFQITDAYYQALSAIQKPSGVLDFLGVPLLISFGSMVSGTGPLPIAIAPAAWISREDRSILFRLAAIVLGSWLIIPFMPFHQPRHFVTTYPLLAVMASVGLDELLKRLSGSPWRLWLQSGALAVIFFPGVAYAGYLACQRLPYFLGIQSEESYLKKKYVVFEGYDILRAIRTSVPKGSRILMLGSPITATFYYIPNFDYCGTSRFPPAYYEKSTVGLARQLKSDGIDYVVFGPWAFDALPDGSHAYNFAPGARFTLPPLSPPCFEPLTPPSPSTLFRIHAAPPCGTTPRHSSNSGRTDRP